MSMQQLISEKLGQQLKPSHLQVINESHMHNVPAGSESHFKVICVSALFDGQTRVQQHRQVNQLLAFELKHGIHALSLKLYTPQQWLDMSGSVASSPACLGGNGH
jgi:BolA protein